MDKDNVNSTFGFDDDSEFSENFYKNIEKVLGEADAAASETDTNNIVADEKTENTDAVPMNDENTSNEEDNSTAKFSFNDTDNEEAIDNELMDINSALAKQICTEMDTNASEMKEKQLKKKRLFRIQSGIILTLLTLVGIGFFLGFTKPGNQLLMKMGIQLSGKIWATWTHDFDEGEDLATDEDYLDAEDMNSKAPEIDPSTIVWPDHPGNGRHEEGVYNVLLLGEEAIGSGDGRGRTDVIVVATLNTKTKSVKLTSLMRDTFVQIPGYKDNKLNTAYEKGGLDLLYETIALNFDLQLDGCVMVNFENFEKIIDKLGGLELTLTAGEAKYLRTTNYISKPEYRDVVEGKQLLNGNQVLGYSRIRKRATISGNNNDYGRTDRHRIVLNAIFDKYKTKSKADLAGIMLDFLPMIKTDIDDECFQLLLNSYMDMGSTELEQLRIPANGSFEEGKVRGMSVLIPDIEENVDILHNFIFGNSSMTAADSLAQNTTGETAADSTGN